MIKNIKCFLGWHDWVDITPVNNVVPKRKDKQSFKIVRTFECSNCGKRKVVTDSYYTYR